MNRHTTTSRAHPPGAPRRSPCKAFVAALFLLCAVPAFASPITFEPVAPTGYAAGESFTQNGYTVRMVNGPLGGNGAVMNDSSCEVVSCPSGATGQYLGILNDGGVNFALTDTSLAGFMLGGFDFAFLAPVGGLSDGLFGRLQLSGLLADGSTINTAFDFPGQGGDGRFSFGAASLDSIFLGAMFKSLTINACMYDEDLVCSNSAEAPAFFTAQFALDNLDLSVVPEPVSLLLFGMGMGALTLSRRRAAANASRHPHPQGA
jgi:hypothetical protein